MWIDRDFSSRVQEVAGYFPALLLTGPRQVGKTALLRRLFPEAGYVTFDDLALARQAETQPGAFLDAQATPLILDEVQYVPGLFRHLKRRLDADPRPGSYLMTGSQSLPLMEGVAESLAGRVGLLELSTLSFPEVQRALPRTTEEEYLLRGGFPRLWTGPAVPPGDFYAAYVATYLERDVRNLKAVGELRDFDRFLRAAALRTGQLLSYADLARDVGIAPNTAKAWVSVLVASGQVILLEPYHRSLGKRLTKSPKLYFVDAGLACHLLGLTREPRALLASPLAGPLFETYVVGQVIRHLQGAKERSPLWFFRTAAGDEVDLLIEHGGRFTAIECKLAEAPGSEALRGFRSLAALYGEPAVERALVACRTAHSYVIPGFGKGRRAATALSTSALVAAL